MEFLQLTPKSVNLCKKIRSLSISQVKKKKIYRNIETEGAESSEDIKKTIKLATPKLKLGERKVKYKSVRRSFPIRRCNLINTQSREVCNDIPLTLKSRFLSQKTPKSLVSPGLKIQFPLLPSSPNSFKVPQVSHILSKIKHSFNQFRVTHNSILQDFNI